MDGKVVGSELIGQNFTSPGYFHGRPSTVDYAANGSGASNYGPTAPGSWIRFASRVEQGQEREQFIAKCIQCPQIWSLPPLAALTRTSARKAPCSRCRGSAGSGASGVGGKAAGLSDIEPAEFAILGQERVNVLRLNLALDDLAAGGAHCMTEKCRPSPDALLRRLKQKEQKAGGRRECSRSSWALWQGVGKTYQMLEEAQSLKKECVDVVVAFVETHGRLRPRLYGGPGNNPTSPHGAWRHSPGGDGSGCGAGTPSCHRSGGRAGPYQCSRHSSCQAVSGCGRAAGGGNNVYTTLNIQHARASTMSYIRSPGFKYARPCRIEYCRWRTNRGGGPAAGGVAAALE